MCKVLSRQSPKSSGLPPIDLPLCRNYPRFISSEPHRERRINVPHGLRSIGHCCLDDAVPIHWSKQCIWKTCVHSPHTEPPERRSISGRGTAREKNTNSVDSRRRAFCTRGSILRMGRDRYHRRPPRHRLQGHGCPYPSAIGQSRAIS